MTQKANQRSGALDTVKWLSVLLLLGLGVTTNYFLSDKQLLLRVLIIAAFFIAALGLSLWTTRGNTFLDFVKEARTEVRKVVWPTRQETMQVTGIVLLVVVVVGLILWGIDALLLHVVAWLTGLGAN